VTRFSVFLPVRNGWPYVQECVESILAQSYPELELHVLDNRSSDRTLEWLHSVKDSRLHVSTSDRSLSITESWARVLACPKQEFMTLIGHDDLLDRDFLATTRALIERFPDAALYQTGSRLINADGGRIRACPKAPERETPAGYLRARFAFERDIFGTGYVMRSADHDRVGGIPPFERLFFADDALWLSLMRGSYKAYDPTESFAVRIHPRSESASLPSAWSPILLGLNQFTAFLRDYTVGDPEAAAVFADQGPDFLLTYHRNVYIYALLEASQAARKIDPAVARQIEQSLQQNAPTVAGQLRSSPKVAALSALNASPMRGLINGLWWLYSTLKTRSS
jgi:glycosyltransferase involved in cell wall biosynthesis